MKRRVKRHSTKLIMLTHFSNLLLMPQNSWNWYSLVLNQPFKYDYSRTEAARRTPYFPFSRSPPSHVTVKTKPANISDPHGGQSTARWTKAGAEQAPVNVSGAKWQVRCLTRGQPFDKMYGLVPVTYREVRQRLCSSDKQKVYCTDNKTGKLKKKWKLWILSYSNMLTNQRKCLFLHVSV